MTLKKESLVLKSIMGAFEGENLETQYCILTYRIDLYFHEYRLAIETDEKEHRDGSIDYEIKRQKAIEKELNCKFVRIYPDEEGFNIFNAQNKIFGHIKEVINKKKKIDGTETLTKVLKLM